MLRDPRLHGLSSDHHHALVLVRSIRKALDAAVDAVSLGSMICGEFERKLEPHFRIEEMFLLPHLERTEPALTERTSCEHAAMRLLVIRIRSGSHEGCRMFADQLEAHVRFEERELFPACEKEVPADVLEEVARRASAASTG